MNHVNSLDSVKITWPIMQSLLQNRVYHGTVSDSDGDGWHVKEKKLNDHSFQNL